MGFTCNLTKKTPCMFANRLHLVALTPLQATKTGSKQPRSHFPPKRRLVPYAYRSFDLLWPISHCFRVTGPGVKKIPFLTDFRKKKYRASVRSILKPPTVTPQSFQGYPISRPGVNGLASSNLQNQHIQKVVHGFGCFWGFLWTKYSRPNGQLLPVACHTFS